MHRITLPVIAVVILLVGGCASTGGSEDWSADRLYEEGKAALERQDYETAIEHFESLEARFPFGPYAQQALLEAAYAYYKFDEPESAISTADRFIKLYPRHTHVDYAYYLKGLARFPDGPGPVERLFGPPDNHSDPSASRESFRHFQELVRRFPDSRYTADARQRMIYLRNQLADYELEVADYYWQRKAYIAAANRAKGVVANYPQTPAIAEALAIMVHAYRALELPQLADDARRVLALNYPQHPTLKTLRQSGQ